MIGAGPSLAQSSHTGPTREEIRSLLDRGIPRLPADNLVPSVSIVHVEASNVVFAGAYGFQDPDVTAAIRTLFLGSIILSQSGN